MDHDVAKRGRDSAKMGHDSAKMGILSSTLERLGVLGAFLKDFRRWVGKRKTLKNRRFSLVFGTFGSWKRCLRHLGGCLRRCCLEGYVFQKFFGHVGDKRANSRGKMATWWAQDGS